MPRVHFAILPVLAAVAGLLAPLPAGAQSYPARPIRLLVGFPPGGAADIVARIIAKKVGENVREQLVVDNRAGAGSVIATEITARAVADGYTLLMTASTIAANVGLKKQLPYDPVTDFTPVMLVASTPNVLVAHPSVPARSVAELVELARAKPGQLNFSSGGIGTLSHLSGELLNMMANIQLTHVAYKGASPALTDVMSGQMQLLFTALPSALTQIKAGRVIAIAVTSARRSPAAPEIPTVAQSGVAGYDATNWYGVLAPAATPMTIVVKLNSEMARALRNEEVIDALTRQGIDVLGSTPQEFARHLKSEIAKWTKVIRAAGIRPE